MSAQGTLVTLTVLHKSGKKHSQHLAAFDLTNVECVALAISGDGLYVVVGQAFTFTVFQKTAVHGGNFTCTLGFFCRRSC